jgi:hypothetical protein
MSVGRLLSKVLRARSLACSRCGSTELYPFPGLLGELGGVLGRVRYACRDCRRHTWLSPDAGIPHRQPDEPELWLQAPCPPKPTASLDALDVGAAPLPPPRTDLRLLDEELFPERGQRKKPLDRRCPRGPQGQTFERARRVPKRATSEPG